MDKLGQTKVLLRSVQEWNALRETEPEFIANLQRANLQRANLQGAKTAFCNANFSPSEIEQARQFAEGLLL